MVQEAKQMKMKKLILTLGLFAGLLFFNTALSAQTVVVNVRPPAPKVVVKKARPGANFVYVSGYWKWNPRRNRHVWVDGRWVRKKPNQVYVAGRWKRVPGGYAYVPGHWRRV